MENPFTHLSADRFNCIHIEYDSEKHTSDVKVLEDQLADAISKWQADKVKAIWAKVKRNDSRMIQAFTDLHFVFHHAKSSYLQMYLWLIESEVFNLPGYATQHLGAGGMVTDEERHPNQMLVVQEQHGLDFWKLPGGLANEGENIEETSLREVYEETGLQCVFRAILSFRQQHGFHFGCSDIYFACLLTPKYADQPIRMQESEIKRCEWMDIDAFAALPTTGELGRSIVKAYKLYRDKHVSILTVGGNEKRLCYGAAICENGM